MCRQVRARDGKEGGEKERKRERKKAREETSSSSVFLARHASLCPSPHSRSSSSFFESHEIKNNSKGKPHPEIFELAASKFDPPPLNPSSVLVFEDAPIGVEAALAAGMRCVFVPDERTPRSEAHDKACVVLKRLEEFDPVAWGLPAWKR